MASISRVHRRFIAIIIWTLGLLLFFGLGLWNIISSRLDAENRMISEASRMSAQLSSLLALSNWELDGMTARAIVMATMEDDRIYAVRIETNQGLMEGQRRNYMWEPIPWDDEIAENCVQGMNPIKIGGQQVGSVSVWISPRISAEEDGLLGSRERWRFIAAALVWTLIFVLVLWQWGELRRMRRFWSNAFSQQSGEDSQNAEQIMSGFRQSGNEGKEKPDKAAEDERKLVISAAAGRRFQRHNPDSWLVTAGMFRQTFARGPALISRLYAEGETAGLCHLGRMLEQAAPCIGADRLARAAKAMQAALNDPECQARAMPVEECASALEEVLNALCGNGQWRSR